LLNEKAMFDMIPIALKLILLLTAYSSLGRALYCAKICFRATFNWWKKIWHAYIYTRGFLL